MTRTARVGEAEGRQDLCNITAMLAYVFWHRAALAAEPHRYRQLMTEFHRSLRRHPTDGFIGSASFELSAGLSWLSGSGTAFEDWYLLRDSAALDPLNDGAVSGNRAATHDAVASKAGEGAGGLYRLRKGTAALDGVTVALWFQKPPGMTYETLYSLLEPAMAPGSAALWGRQMVLGPAPEFCLQLQDDVPLPPQLDVARFALRRVYPEPQGSALLPTPQRMDS